MFKSILQLEEDTFGGPIYHHDQLMVVSNTVSNKKVVKDAAKKVEEKKTDAKKKGAKEKKESKPTDKSDQAAWTAVENPETLLHSHVLPLFYYLCLTKPPKDVVFL